MRRATNLALISVCSVLGIADAWYLAEHALTDTALSCSFGSTLSGCNTVAQSAYSHFFGVPLGIYGVVFYSLVLLASLAAYRLRSRRLDLSILGLGIVGALASAYFVALQVFVIKALCVYCVGSFVLSLVILVAALLLARKDASVVPVM
jgi:uncharacterized membrane protein